MGINLRYADLTEEDINSLHYLISENVKRLRKERKISQIDLATFIGHKSQSTIAKIEAHIENKHYNIEQLYKISLVLDVNITEFFKGVNELSF